MTNIPQFPNIFTRYTIPKEPTVYIISLDIAYIKTVDLNLCRIGKCE
jgi:hypothetical protein